ncbi:hypothetical protein E4U55_000571 [Claviceps digitariae]|nr:hypothetical protein E4U55_000571 [Claviceps digitariae]
MSKMSKYLVSEPAPSSSYIRCGRGGAGNTFHVRASSNKPATTTTTTTTTITTSSPSSSSSSAAAAAPSRRVFSGIGGAGNVHPISAMPSLADSLDDALRHAAARDSLPLGYCGRGGAGNIYRRQHQDCDADAAPASSSSSVCSGESLKSNGSTKGRLWKRLSGFSTRD